MYDIKLACYTNPWGKSGFVQAIKDIEECGFDGVEYSAKFTQDYNDRLHVFQEIIGNSGLEIVNLIQEIDLLDRENADMQVEKAMASARFISAAGSKLMTICHAYRRDAPMNDDEWATACAVLEEIAERCLTEYNLQICYMPRNTRLVFHEKDIFRLLASTNKKFVKLALDTAEITLAGSTPQKLIKSAFDRIGIVRFHDVSASKKRAKFTDEKIPSSTPQFGRGAVDFNAICKLLVANEYQGWVSLDVSGDGHAPAEAVNLGYRYLLRHSGLFDF